MIEQLNSSIWIYYSNRTDSKGTNNTCQSGPSSNVNEGALTWSLIIWCNLVSYPRHLVGIFTPLHDQVGAFYNHSWEGGFHSFPSDDCTHPMKPK